MSQAVNQFDWVEFYKEFAEKLLAYKDNRQELIIKVKQIFTDTGINMPTLEKDNQIVDIDPFTVFGLFNKSSMKAANRVNTVKLMTLTISGNCLSQLWLMHHRPPLKSRKSYLNTLILSLTRRATETVRLQWVYTGFRQILF